MTLDTLMTAPEGALQAGVSRERIVRLLQKGILRGTSIGGRWFVEEASLQEWLATQHNGPKPRKAT